MSIYRIIAVFLSGMATFAVIDYFERNNGEITSSETITE
jgi:hypothetical protein